MIDLAWFWQLSPDDAADELTMIRERFEVFIRETLEQYERDKTEPKIIASVRATLAQWHKLNVKDAAAMAKRRAERGQKAN